MKKQWIILLMSFMLNFSLAKSEQKEEVLHLPNPQIEGGLPIMEALSKRHSSRTFSDKPISNQLLSNLLWATWGINRDNGHRTAPTADNNQLINIYVVNEEGVWLYSAEKNQLGKVLGGNYTKRFKAPLTFVYTSPDDRLNHYPIGALFQNAGIFSAAFGLNNVVRDQYNGILYGKLPLPETFKIQITQSFGWPVQ